MTAPWTPDDGHVWTEHKPGDPMPCDGGVVVKVLLDCERKVEKSMNPTLNISDLAKSFRWTNNKSDGDVVAWRRA